MALRQFKRGITGVVQGGNQSGYPESDAEPGDIRDFIYLDVERVRSIVAQRAGGLPGERTQQSGHNVGGTVSAEGGIPMITKAGA